MKLIPTTKDNIALVAVATVSLGFFTAGLSDVLDYFIVQAILFLSFTFLFVLAAVYAIKNKTKKNRHENKFQDDSH